MQAVKNGEYLTFTMEQAWTIREFLESFHVGRKKIHELYMDKALLVDGLPQSPHFTMEPGQTLTLPVFREEEVDFEPQDQELDILYEDDHLLVINKKAGLAVYPEAKTGTGTVVNGVAAYFLRQGCPQRVRYIHRLDVETTGCLLFAKNFLVHGLLDHQLSLKEIKRRYLALASGRFRQSRGLIDLAIARDRHHPARRRVSKTGDDALTFYRVQKQLSGFALVELELKTGRTHQIRVHLSHLGHPLLGDKLYGPARGPKPKISRHALHSWQVELLHPLTKAPLFIEALLPEDMKQLL